MEVRGSKLRRAQAGAEMSKSKGAGAAGDEPDGTQKDVLRRPTRQMVLSLHAQRMASTFVGQKRVIVGSLEGKPSVPKLAEL